MDYSCRCILPQLVTQAKALSPGLGFALVPVGLAFTKTAVERFSDATPYPGAQSHQIFALAGCPAPSYQALTAGQTLSGASHLIAKTTSSTCDGALSRDRIPHNTDLPQFQKPDPRENSGPQAPNPARKIRGTLSPDAIPL